MGGPVQPGRECYLQRNADAELYERLGNGQYCHVLAQRQSGKTSLLANTAWRLRKNGAAVAVVDLTQASGEDVSENAGRWYYSIAYRIVRDLRIKSDVQAWWKDRGGLTNLQRLREFFLEIVLEETDGQVVVCLDRVEATMDQPLAQDLFSVVRSCYDARATQVDFQRLSFVLAGSAAQNEVVRNVQGSVFEVSRGIQLPDFSSQELSGLVHGLGALQTDPEVIIRRVWSWTRGHPYLSQKVMRGLARRNNAQLQPNDVDELVRDQFVGPNAIKEEPHLASVAEQLLREGSGKVPRLNLYGRVRKGIEVMAGADTGAQHELSISGVIAEHPSGELRVRNEIYAMVFDTRWVNQNLAFGFKGLATAAMLVLALLALPIWYTEYLPRPYVQALSSVTTDHTAALAAHESLADIPGYAATADRLLADHFAAKINSATEYREILLPLSSLRLLADGPDRANSLVAGFWDRKARSLMHIGDRDGALVSLLESLQQDEPQRRQKLGELVGEDYDRLLASRHSEAPVKTLIQTSPDGAIGWLDENNNVEIWQLDNDQLLRKASLKLYAEEQPDLVLRAMVTRSGSRPRLTIRTNHPRPEQIVVNMQAPSGQRAALSLRRAQQISTDSYRIDFAAFTRLQNMRGAELVGNWTIAISDMEKGVSGDLLAWSLDFAEARRPVDSALVKQPIPEPRPSENAETHLAENGKRALSWPANDTTRGPVVVWDIAEKNIIARIPRDDAMFDARLIADGTRVVTIEPRRLVVWDAETGKRIGAVRADDLADSPPAFSTNGRFVATRKRRSDDRVGIVIWDLSRLAQVGPAINISSAVGLAVDNQGHHLAVAGTDPWARIWSVRSGRLLHEFEHISPLRQMVFDNSGNWLATDDFSNTFRLWNLNANAEPIVERLGNSPWQMNFSADSLSLMVGSLDRAYELIQVADGASAGVYLWHSVKQDESSPRSQRESQIAGPILFSDLNLAVTNDGERDIKFWRIPNYDSESAQRLMSLPSGSRAALSTDGKRIAVGERGGAIQIHAVGAPGSVNLPAQTDGSSMSPAPVVMEFSPNRDVLASATMDGGLRLWNTTDGALRGSVVEHSDGAVHDVVFTSGGTHVVSASRREVLVTEIESGEVQALLRIQANHPQLSYAADTGMVYIADDLDGVTIWDWRNQVSERLLDTQYRIRKAVATPDGRFLVTAGVDRRLRLWNTETRTMLTETVLVASKVDEMWVATGGGQVVVHAGHWLHAIALYPTGLRMHDTRLLVASPSAVQPFRDGSGAHVLVAAPGRPVVLEQPIDRSIAPALEGDAAELRAYWRSKLALSLNADGEIEAI